MDCHVLCCIFYIRTKWPLHCLLHVLATVWKFRTSPWSMIKTSGATTWMHLLAMNLYLRANHIYCKTRTEYCQWPTYVHNNTGICCLMMGGIPVTMSLSYVVVKETLSNLVVSLRCPLGHLWIALGLRLVFNSVRKLLWVCRSKQEVVFQKPEVTSKDLCGPFWGPWRTGVTWRVPLGPPEDTTKTKVRFQLLFNKPTMDHHVLGWNIAKWCIPV